MGAVIGLIDDLSSKSTETRRYVSKFLSKYLSKIKGKWQYFSMREKKRERMLSQQLCTKSFKEVLQAKGNSKDIHYISILDGIDSYKIFHLIISA